MTDIELYSWLGEFAELKADDQRSIAQIVKDGGAIVGNIKQVINRLSRTQMLLLFRDQANDRIVGVVALKTPSQKYRANKFAAAGVPITGFKMALELGYVVVAEDMRGRRLSGDLVNAIKRCITEPVFATTDSNTMKNNLTRSGFTMAGKEWQGQKAMLSLWILTPCKSR